MDDKKRSLARTCIVFAAVFAAALALCRFFDIKSAAWAADVMAGDGAAGAAGIVSVVLSVAAVAFSGGALIFTSVSSGKKAALILAVIFSVLVFADRSFYIVYSIVTNVRSFTADAGPDAYIRVGSDAASLIIAYFVLTFAANRMTDAGKDAVRTKRVASLVFAAVLTLGEAAYQTYYTVCFFRTYDDVTSIEKSRIASDYLFILMKYGVIMFGGALFFSYLTEKIINGKRNHAQTDDKIKKT